MAKFALGLMSGTSADGLTVCAVRPAPFKVLHFKNYAYPARLQNRLLHAVKLTAPELSLLNYELGELYAKTVRRFLKDFHLNTADILVTGSHGQTVYHGPHEAIPNTLQIGDASFLACETGAPVVSDFRAKDIALGGEGAPLMPFFDEYIWGQSAPKILLNVGGISNFSAVGKHIKTFGFDVGPGNTLIDLACQQILNKPFDKNGQTAARGTPDKKLVSKLLKQKFFAQKPPKSLDKNEFGQMYLEKYFGPLTKKTAPDELATLTYFTAAAVARAVTDFVPKNAQKELVVSGGGCYNQTLLKFLRELLPHMKVTTTLAYGIDPQAKEAAAFALFGWLTLKRRINHCARATGARKNTILGKITL
uniref:Anhydro-N-acetylmuramic acid kinase n=1 Tax=uncultured Elusimicrobia bacterium TaxID=699876 RepID=A0A650EPQ7_9BACT|nr:anhydro-N-acetylmuramic acid kinase [uncultured Elusimicrobia bacterium]